MVMQSHIHVHVRLFKNIIHIQLHDDNVALNTALLVFQYFKSEKICLLHTIYFLIIKICNRFIHHLRKHITFY